MGIYAPLALPSSGGLLRAPVLRATGGETQTPVGGGGLGRGALSRQEICFHLTTDPRSLSTSRKVQYRAPGAWARLRSRVFTEISSAESRGTEASFSTLLPRGEGSAYVRCHSPPLGNELSCPSCHQPPNTSSWDRSGPQAPPPPARSWGPLPTPAPDVGLMERAGRPRQGPGDPAASSGLGCPAVGASPGVPAEGCAEVAITDCRELGG